MEMNMTIIKNGSHDGDYGMKVSQEGRGQTDSVSESNDRHINVQHQKVWSLPFEGIDPVGADDYFFYLKQTALRFYGNRGSLDEKCLISVFGFGR